ncbi:MAG: DUF3021 domain-containing protein [Lachnospiraceae bacterium]|nr:DUF3021 domain-containing protein [Lachnospiraceae bacterium]
MGIANKILTKSLIGFMVGMVIGVVFWMLSGHALGESDNATLILHLVGSGLLGMLSMGGAVVYDIESWGLLKATVFHYITCMIAFSLASALLNWFTKWEPFIVMCVIMTFVYAGIWIGKSLHWKRTINGLNEQLKSIQK